MKSKLIVIAGILASVLAAGNAKADQYCSLSVSSTYVPIGQLFSFDIYVSPTLAIFPGPHPPGGVGGPPLTVIFYGTKDGVNDIPYGFQHPGTFGSGYSNLTGYGNPAGGGFSGNYVRYAVVYNRFGQEYCVTNAVGTVLQ